METYDLTYTSYAYDKRDADKEAMEYAAGFVFSECDTTDQPISYVDYVGTTHGIDVYYNYGADYYFFADNA